MNDTYLDYIKSQSHDELVNDAFNDAIERLDLHRDTKAIPYMGWFWRNITILPEPCITIAKGDGMVAVCESNKWGYPTRLMTREEADRFIEMVDRAVTLNHKGDSAQRDKVLQELFDWMQTLVITEGNYGTD